MENCQKCANIKTALFFMGNCSFFVFAVVFNLSAKPLILFVITQTDRSFNDGLRQILCNFFTKMHFCSRSGLTTPGDP